MSDFDQKLERMRVRMEAALENERYIALVAPRNCIGRLDQPYFIREYMESVLPPFDRVPKHNNELLLLL